MEILATIGLAGNILQFVDFSGKVISNSKQLYSSVDGILIENADIERITKDLKALNAKFSRLVPSNHVFEEPSLKNRLHIEFISENATVCNPFE